LKLKKLEKLVEERRARLEERKRLWRPDDEQVELKRNARRLSYIQFPDKSSANALRSSRASGFQSSSEEDKEVSSEEGSPIIRRRKNPKTLIYISDSE
jgi:hypothetical protein